MYLGLHTFVEAVRRKRNKKKIVISSAQKQDWGVLRARRVDKGFVKITL